MAHNSLIRPGGWNLNTTVSPSEFATLDQNQASSVNGDGGGTYAPTTPIIIGGAGMQLSFAAPPTYVTPRTKQRMVNLGEYYAAGTVATKASPTWGAALINADMESFPNGVSFTALGTSGTPNAFAVSLNPYLEHGSTLASATLYWAAVASHPGVPTNQPFFGIFSVPSVVYDNLNLSIFSRSLLSTYWATDNAASLAAYQAANRSVLWTPDQNTLIDRTAYSYFAIVADESGTYSAAGNSFSSILLNMSGITNVSAT